MIDNSMIESNITDNNGGGLCVKDADITIRESTFSDNRAKTGGGIYDIGNGSSGLEISSSTFVNNQATTGNGGAIYSRDNVASVDNSTLSGNTANFRGGGIYNIGDMQINLSTIVYNTANELGGGVANIGAGSIEVAQTIIATNAANNGTDCYGNPGDIISQGYTLIRDDNGCNFTPATGDQIGTTGSPIDPLIDALQDNGGPTHTHALLMFSPARNMIPVGVCLATVDQRGAPRPTSGPELCDIGAVEQ